MGDAFPHLLVVGPCFHMGGIHKHFGWIHEFIFITFKKDMFEYLLKKVGIFKTAGIVLSKRGEMRDFIEHIQPKEPAVCNIDFNLPAGLAHAFDPIKILDKRDLDQHDLGNTFLPPNHK